MASTRHNLNSAVTDHRPSMLNGVPCATRLADQLSGSAFPLSSERGSVISVIIGAKQHYRPLIYGRPSQICTWVPGP